MMMIRFLLTIVVTSVLGTALLFQSPPAEANPSMRDIALVTAGLIGWAATHPGTTPIGHGANIFSIGAFDRVDRIRQTLDIEYQHLWGRDLLWRFKPFAGAGLTGRRSVYGFGGLELDLHFGPHLRVIAPSEALTLYLHGGGKRLGSPLDFRSGIDVLWGFENGVSIGLGYHHISHWFLFGSFNPGTEILNLTLSIPVTE